jgi:hypothetical protein
MRNDDSCRHSHATKTRCIKFLTLPIVFCDDLANKVGKLLLRAYLALPVGTKENTTVAASKGFSQCQAIEHPYSTVNKFGIKQVTFTDKKSNIDTKPICVQIKK